MDPKLAVPWWPLVALECQAMAGVPRGLTRKLGWARIYRNAITGKGQRGSSILCLGRHLGAMKQCPKQVFL